jgi:DnaJ-like protein
MANRPVLDPYAVLGVPRDASALQVARARRQLAKRFHPDLHPGQDVSESMRRVNEAWYILSSAHRRAEYDRAHPRAGTPAAGHWAPSMPNVRPMQQNTTTRNWATWRTTAEETRAAPRTRRQPGEIPVVTTRRPPPITPPQPTFRDSGWAALLVALVLLALLVAAVVAGRLA